MVRRDVFMILVILQFVVGVASFAVAVEVVLRWPCEELHPPIVDYPNTWKRNDLKCDKANIHGIVSSCR